MEDRLGRFAIDLPVRDDMRMLADQREALVGMRGELEEQERQTLRGARADGDVGAIDGDAVGMRDRARLEQAPQLDALPLAFAQERDDVGHGMDAADQKLTGD